MNSVTTTGDRLLILRTVRVKIRTGYSKNRIGVFRFTEPIVSSTTYFSRKKNLRPCGQEKLLPGPVTAKSRHL